MRIDERANYNDGTNNAPKPISGGAKSLIDIPAFKFVPDTIGYFMEPDKICDSESNRAN